MNSKISKINKIIIYKNAGVKYLRGMYYRFLLGKSNGAVWVGKHVDMTHCRNIKCGKNVKFESYCEIHALCSEGLNFGNSVTIGRGTMIRPSSYYGGDLGIGLTIGDNSSIGPHGYVGCSGRISIGENVMIGPKCSLFAENHNFSDLEKTIKSQGVNSKGIIIEDDCWIGSNVIILDGVTIGKGSVIGAGTIVVKDVAPYSVIVDRRERIGRMRGRQR